MDLNNKQSPAPPDVLSEQHATNDQNDNKKSAGDSFDVHNEGVTKIKNYAEPNFTTTDKLSQVPKRAALNSWKNSNYLMPPEMVERLKRIVLGECTTSWGTRRSFFGKISRMEGTVYNWKENFSNSLYPEILKRLESGNFQLQQEEELLINMIFNELCLITFMKPDLKSMDPRIKFLHNTSKQITQWLRVKEKPVKVKNKKFKVLTEVNVVDEKTLNVAKEKKGEPVKKKSTKSVLAESKASGDEKVKKSLKGAKEKKGEPDKKKSTKSVPGESKASGDEIVKKSLKGAKEKKEEPVKKKSTKSVLAESKASGDEKVKKSLKGAKEKKEEPDNKKSTKSVKAPDEIGKKKEEVGKSKSTPSGKSKKNIVPPPPLPEPPPPPPSPPPETKVQLEIVEIPVKNDAKPKKQREKKPEEPEPVLQPQPSPVEVPIKKPKPINMEKDEPVKKIEKDSCNYGCVCQTKKGIDKSKECVCHTQSAVKAPCDDDSTQKIPVLPEIMDVPLVSISQVRPWASVLYNFTTTMEVWNSWIHNTALETAYNILIRFPRKECTTCEKPNKKISNLNFPILKSPSFQQYEDETGKIFEMSEKWACWIKEAVGKITMSLEAQKGKPKLYQCNDTPSLIPNSASNEYANGLNRLKSGLSPNELLDGCCNKYKCTQEGNTTDMNLKWKWVNAENGTVPCGMVAGGIYNKEKISIGKVMHNGIQVVGNIIPSMKGCFVTWNAKTGVYPKYQVLSQANTVWVDSSSKNISKVKFIPIDESKEPKLFIGRVCIDGNYTIGTVICLRDIFKCVVLVNSQEKLFDNFEILGEKSTTLI